MRIPSDLTAPYLIEITERPQPDNSRAEPVDAMPPLDDALAEAPLDQRPDAEDQAPARAQGSDGLTIQTVTVERRLGERRREKRPTLHDTRTAVARRRASRHTRINAKA